MTTLLQRVTEFVFNRSFIVLPPLILLLGNFLVFVVSTLRPRAFPPGPQVVPGFGNLFQINRDKLHLTFGSWSKKYVKDVPIGIKKGPANVVVLNTGHLVRELLEKRGALYSDRPWNFIYSAVFKDDLRTSVFQDKSAWLTNWRRAFNNNFGPAAVKKNIPVYEAETARFLVKLIESPGARKTDLEFLIVSWVTSLPCLGACGRRPDYLSDHGIDLKELKSTTEAFNTLHRTAALEVFPILRYVPEILGLASWKAEARRVRESCIKLGKAFVEIAQEQRAALDAGKAIEWESVLSKMLKGKRDNKEDMFTFKDIGHSALTAVAGSSNTSLAIVMVMMLVLAKYPEVQKRARDEVLLVSGGGVPKAEDLSSMKYLEAFMNECHRWRPVGPLSIPHSPSEDDVYAGYRIPKGTAVLPNVWSIHHSVEDFDDPEKFNPERFLNHPFGMRSDEAHDPAALEASGARVHWDFGAGRRICPGMYSARLNLMLGIAKLLWAFEILPPEGQEINLDQETGFIQEVVQRSNNFDVVLKRRDGVTNRAIVDHYDEMYEGEAKIMGWEGGLYR